MEKWSVIWDKTRFSGEMKREVSMRGFLFQLAHSDDKITNTYLSIAKLNWQGIMCRK